MPPRRKSQSGPAKDGARGERIREAMAEAGIKPSDLVPEYAKDLGTVSGWRYGERISDYNLARLAELCRVRFKWLKSAEEPRSGPMPETGADDRVREASESAFDRGYRTGWLAALEAAEKADRARKESSEDGGRESHG